MNIKPINTKKTYQYVTEQIINLIVSGELSVGDKLPSERVLADEFEVSRSSIREAFRAMEIVGIIEVKPGGGTYVTDFNIAPFINTIAPLLIRNVDIKEDLMAFRIMLEGETVKLAARVHDEGSLKAIYDANKLMEEAVLKDSQMLSEKADVDFHMAIFNATKNRIYMKAGESLSYILEASIHSNRIKLLKDRQNSQRWLAEHLKIYESIKTGNENDAYEAMCGHLENVRRLL
jgi:GntR family transcriptional repressor for pyruvate dehydrogenase complex